MVRHAQIERLRALKKRINEAQQRHDGKIEAAVVLVGVAELVNILLTEVEGMTDGVVIPQKGRIE